MIGNVQLKPADIIGFGTFLFVGFMALKKKKWVGILLIVISVGFLAACFLAPASPEDHTDSHNAAATTAGKDSPAINVSGTASERNSVVQQAVNSQGANINNNSGTQNTYNAPASGTQNIYNAPVNYNGLTPEMFAMIQEHMRQKERESQAALTNTFPGGYAIFTKTTGSQIILLDRKSDQNLFDTSWTNCSIEFKPESITITSPDMVYHTKHIKYFQMGSFIWTVRRNVGIGEKWLPVWMPEGKLGMMIIGTNEDAFTVAIGIAHSM